MPEQTQQIEQTNHSGWILLGVFISGSVIGATAMFYLTKLEIILPSFNPTPFLLTWLFIVSSWFVGRLVGINRRQSANER
jgi:hypothetical protein